MSSNIEVKVKAESPARELPRDGQADAIIGRNVLWALGAGMVIVPLADLAALMAVQIKLLKELSDLYEIPFFEGAVKKLMGALLSTVLGVGFAVVVGGSLSKLLPGVGAVIGGATLPVFAGAFTRATGNLFKMHFESGGTLLDLDAGAMREHFMRELEQARRSVSRGREARK